MEHISTKINYRACRAAELWSDEDDISWLVFLPEIEVEADDAAAIIQTAGETFVGEAYVVLADIRLMKSISNEARTYLASQQGEQLHAAVAILVDSMATRLIANFFINFHKPSRPTRIFTDERKAVEWLKRYLPPKKENKPA
jgi:hypothetical protein